MRSVRSDFFVRESVSNGSGAQAGHRDGSFDRMKRIGRITRIGLCGIRFFSPESLFFLLFSRRGLFGGSEAIPSGSSQKIPALVLRALTPRGAIRVVSKIRFIRMNLPSR
jgi:hypothetical protein